MGSRDGFLIDLSYEINYENWIHYSSNVLEA